jgi:hypothetical protein
MKRKYLLAFIAVGAVLICFYYLNNEFKELAEPLPSCITAEGAFKYDDNNGDGFIVLEEWQKNAPSQLPPFASVDVNDDGSIDFSEYKSVYRCPEGAS